MVSAVYSLTMAVSFDLRAVKFSLEVISEAIVQRNVGDSDSKHAKWQGVVQ